MFFGAIVLPSKAQQLEQERAALGVGRVVPNLGAQRLDRFVESSRLKELASVHQPTTNSAYALTFAGMSQPVTTGDSPPPLSFCGT